MIQLRRLGFSVLKRTAGLRRFLRDKGLGRIPLVFRAYDFLYAHLAAAEVSLVSANDMPMYVYVRDVGVGKKLYLDGVFEPNETRLVKSLLRQGMAFVDLGANFGYYSLLAARAVGETGRVFAFEPDPSNFALLRRNIELNRFDNVTAVQKAVSNRTGTAVFYLDRDDLGGHSLFDLGQGTESAVVEVTTLDEYFADQDLAVDFIKMDIQQAEPQALQGMKGLLERGREVRLITEFEPARLRRSGVDPMQFLDELLELGFRLFAIHEDRVEPVEPRYVIETYSAANRSLFCERV